MPFLRVSGMSTNLRLKDWKLRHKIILHVAVIGILTASVLGFLFVTAQNRIFRLLNAQTFELVSSLIECNVSHRMLKEDIADIQPALQRLALSSRLLRIRILDSSGRIRRSSDPAETGGRVSRADRERLDRTYSDPNARDLFQVELVSSARSFMAVRNKPDCLSCHEKDGPFIGIIDLEIDSDMIDGPILRNRLSGLAIALVALVLLVLVILRLFEKIINRPLSGLRSAMEKVREGDFGDRPQPKKNDEIGELTRSFTAMVQDLQSAHQRIDGLHKRQMGRASHLASMGELAAGLAHEIKNPLSGIKGALEIIRQRTRESEPIREIYDEILLKIDRINDLVQDLLTYARPRPLRMLPADINHCVAESVRLARGQARDRPIRFDVHDLEGDPMVVMDEHKIQEVLLNLLLNGMAAIEGEGVIRIQTRSGLENQVAIEIRDSGRGIDENNLPRIFDPFFTTRQLGTGLGLTISRQNVEAHGGGIDVRSRIGEGTVFIVHLPRTQVESPHAS